MLISMSTKRKQINCTCQAWPFIHRFDPSGYCMDFLPKVRDEEDKEPPGDWWEEKYLDDRHRAADINEVSFKRG